MQTLTHMSPAPRDKTRDAQLAHGRCAAVRASSTAPSTLAARKVRALVRANTHYVHTMLALAVCHTSLSRLLCSRRTATHIHKYMNIYTQTTHMNIHYTSVPMASSHALSLTPKEDALLPSRCEHRQRPAWRRPLPTRGLSGLCAHQVRRLTLETLLGRSPIAADPAPVQPMPMRGVLQRPIGPTAARLRPSSRRSTRSSPPRGSISGCWRTPSACQSRRRCV